MMVEVMLEPCATCPRRELEFADRTGADRAICHMVMDGVYVALDDSREAASRRSSLRSFTQAKIDSGMISPAEAKAAESCASMQLDQTCGHFALQETVENPDA